MPGDLNITEKEVKSAIAFLASLNLYKSSICYPIIYGRRGCVQNTNKFNNITIILNFNSSRKQAFYCHSFC